MFIDRRFRAPATLIALALAFVACSDSSGPSQQAECTGNVTVQVSSGLTPTISWSPSCRLFVVGVEADDGDTWVIISEGGNRISSGVRYGTVPAGATSDEPAIPLVAGRTYTVFLGRYTGPGSDDGVIAGLTTFTP